MTVGEIILKRERGKVTLSGKVTSSEVSNLWGRSTQNQENADIAKQQAPFNPLPSATESSV